VKDKLIKSIAI